MIDQTKYYVEPSPMTYIPDEPKLKTLLEGSPKTVPEIVEFVQNALIHAHWAERYGLKLTPERLEEVNTRSAANMLRKMYAIKPSPLTEKRELHEKLVGNCRDFTVLSVALMRVNGIPARARCGFGAYFSASEDKIQFGDHWVAEYWNGSRWVLVDAQIDDFQRNALSIHFDTLDVPHDQFITGGAAWTMCKEGADPDSFGINDMHGWWFVRGDMVRDLAALVKIPLLPWDVWGVMIEGVEVPEELMKRVAEVTIPATESYEEILALNEHPLLKVPEVIGTWQGSTMKQVDLREETEEM